MCHRPSLEVLVVADLPPRLLEPLRRRAAVHHRPAAPLPDRQELSSVLPTAVALLCTNQLALPEAVLRGAPRLRVISQLGAGLDNVDQAAAARLRITVMNTPDAMTDAVADLALGLILLQARKLVASFAQVQHPGWGQVGHVPLGHDLRGQRLGIVGMGRIGHAVAARATAFGMRIAYADVAPVTAPYPRLRLGELLEGSDVVSLHVDLNPSTARLIGRSELRRMKRSAVLVNVSRGAVVDQMALFEALRDGWIAGAAVDVLEHEPPRPDDPLLRLPNLVVTPHVGAATVEARQRMAESAVANLCRELDRGGHGRSL
jgi:phosphoglycerate dehydrogenase-like enzyme